MAAQTVVIDVIANFKDNLTAGVERVKGSTDRFMQSIQKAKREVDRLGSTRAEAKLGVVDKATSTINKIDRSLKSVGGKTFNAIVKIKDFATAPLKAIKNTLFSMKGLVATIGAGLAANQLLVKPIGLADAYTGAKIGFSTLLGNKEGQQMMDNLDAFAKKTPFGTSDVIANAQKMLGMGWDPNSILKDLDTIGDAAAATGKGTEGLSSIMRALAQIKTHGRVYAEELNQLSEAGIKARQYLAEGLGYGSDDAGMAKLMKALQKGEIGANEAIEAIMKGMQEFDGMMEHTANETVEGLKSQIEDTFEINILRKWGQGLQDGAKRGFGSIVELLDKSEGTLAKFGDTVYEIGKELSNWSADKLESTIDKIIRITNREEFKNASLGGKIKILWDEVIAEPFATWWDAKGKPFMIDKFNSIGEGLGSGLTKGILALLGVDIGDTGKDAMTIGGSFASGFAKGFESKKVGSAIVKTLGKAFTSGFKALFQGSALEKIIAGGIAFKVTQGVMNGLSAVQTLWSGTGAMTGAGGLTGAGELTLAGMGLKGILGSTGNAMVNGSGILGKLATLGYKATGGGITPAMYFGGNLAGSMSGGMAALAGGVTAAGIAGGVAGLGNSISDLISTIKSDTKNDKNLYGTRAVTKAGMVGTGALIGSFFGPLGTAVGAGLGGVATYLAGNKLADSLSGVTKSTAELNEEAEKLAAKDMAKRFGEITLSADQLAKRIENIYGAKTINKIDRFNQSLTDLENVQDSILNYRDDIGYTHARIMGKETLSESDIANYQTALEGYAEATKQLLTTKKTSATNAFKLLYGDDTKGLQKATKGINKTYTDLEDKLAKKSKKLNEVIAKAFEDGKITINEEKKINELVEQIEKIQDQVEKRIRQKEQAKDKAAYDLINMKYKDKDLSAESYQALVDEINAQNEKSLKSYDDAFIEAKAELDLEFDGKKNTKAYKDALAEIEEKWRNGKAIVVKQGIEVSLNILKTNYSGEIKKLKASLNKDWLSDNEFINLRKNTSVDLYTNGGRTKKGSKITWNKDSVSYFEELKNSFLENAGVDLKVQKQMKEFYNSLKPQEQDLLELKKSYEDAGKKVPEWIENSLADIENIKLMSGDMDSFYKIIGEQIATQDKEYAERLINEAGENLPKALREGIEKGLASLESEPVTTKTDVKVEAGEVDTANAKEKTDNKTKSELGKTVETEKTGKVKVKSETTGADTAAQKSKTIFVEAANNQYAVSVNEKGHVSVNGVEVSGVATAISNAWAWFKEKVVSKFNQTINTRPSIKTTINRRFGSAPSGSYSERKANGGYVDKAVNTIVGEAGPEMIIPLSANRRQRGKYLWERAGRAMGLYGSTTEEKVYMNANGGLYGHGSGRLSERLNNVTSAINTESTPTASRNNKVTVQLGGINISVQASGNNVAEAIRQQKDEIMGLFAEMVEEAFENMPLTVG